MATRNSTIQILDPRAEDVPEEVGLNTNLPSLKGKVVGLLETASTTQMPSSKS